MLKRADIQLLLDNEQLAAANAPEPHVVVLAAAGSGKTRTLVHRVIWLLDQGVAPSTIIVTTFTRKAADELVERIRIRVGEAADRLSVGTFHALCRKWLIAVGHHFFAEVRPWTLIEPWQREATIRKILADLGGPNGSAAVKACDCAITVAQNSLWSRREAESGLPQSGTVSPVMLAAVVDKYRNDKRLKTRYDFDDWQEAVLDELRTSSLLSLSLSEARHILVDEAQDLNVVQVRILEALRRLGLHQTLVGDDYQSIYAFRAAKPDSLIEASASKDWRTYIMSTNYRSRRPVVEATNNLILYNRQRTHKKAKPSKGGGPALRFETADGEAAELAIVRSAVSTVPLKESGEPDAAVLVRSNRLARLLERDLIRHKIAYVVIRGRTGGLFGEAETKPLAGWIRMILDDNDADALRASFSAPSRYLKRADAEGVAVEAGNKGLEFALRRRGGKWQDIAEDIARFRKLVESGASAALLIETLLELGPPLTQESLRQALLRRATNAAFDPENEAQSDEWNDDLIAEEETLIPVVEDFANSCTSMDELGAAVRGGPLAKTSPVVAIGTLHQAKGLEWSVVCLPFFVEGTIPDFRARGNVVEEERRLAYVGATRAMDALVVSWTRGRYSWTPKNAETHPSRFVDELQRPPSVVTKTRNIFAGAVERLGRIFRS